MLSENSDNKEELIAEITASFLCSYTQIENKVIDNSVAYLNSWISKLANDKFMIVKAASDAQKAFNSQVIRYPSSVDRKYPASQVKPLNFGHFWEVLLFTCRQNYDRNLGLAFYFIVYLR